MSSWAIFQLYKIQDNVRSTGTWGQMDGYFRMRNKNSIKSTPNLEHLLDVLEMVENRRSELRLSV